MSPTKRNTRKHDQRTRQDRGKAVHLAPKAISKIERQRVSSSQQRIASNHKDDQKPYNLRSGRHRCPQCGGHCSGHNFQSDEQILTNQPNGLCQGKDEDGRIRRAFETCLVCRRKSPSETTDPHHLHSAMECNRMPDATYPIKDVRRDCHPEGFPDLDFYLSFGSFLTRRNPILHSVDQDIDRYWTLLNESPTTLQYHIHDIGDRYREAFQRFFTAEPISLHGHVIDASSPALLTSLISHLTSSYSARGSNPFLGEEDKTNPCIAVIEGSYGAGYGPLAHNSVLEFVRPLANGRKPRVIKTNCAAKIDDQLKKAKKTGCVAVIAEIVRARDGTVISETAWKHLLRACKKHSLILVVDEALTSIRCGAPFAYQLPQFQKHGFPDLVLFGKAVKTNGVAVEWRGINMRNLGLTDPEERLFTALQWQERLTEMAPAASLLTSWGTIVLAGREKWPQRARETGLVLRRLIGAEGIESNLIGGLHGLIYLRVQDQARVRSPVMGANAGKYVRWFPTMDTVMSSEEALRTKVFGAGSIAHRRDVSAYLKSKGIRLGFCSKCGQAVEADLKPACQLCVVEICEECEPDGHACPMEGISYRTKQSLP